MEEAQPTFGLEGQISPKRVSGCGKIAENNFGMVEQQASQLSCVFKLG